MKRTTIQDIANALGISRTSVWKVFNDKNGVSDDLRKKVIEKAQELNYNLPKEVPAQLIPPQKQKNIALAVCQPETSIFWMSIIHEIARELSKHQVNLIYTYLPRTVSEDYMLPPQLTSDMTDGIIIMNVYDQTLINHLNNLNIPKVFMDTATQTPLDSLTGDIILSEGRSCTHEITSRLIKQGLKKIGFIGDIGYALTNYERYKGYLQAMAENHLVVNRNFCMTDALDIHNHAKEIDHYIGTLKALPQAFICASDYVASLVWQSLESRGYDIPDDILIAGFDGNADSPVKAALTTVQVYNQDLGRRLATQILYRTKYPDARYETTYISSEVVFRSSTSLPAKSPEHIN